MERKHYEKGEVIFKEGELGRELYEVKHGRVGIYAAYGTSDEKKLTELGEGRIFGEMAVIEVFPRSATAVALEDTEAEAVSGENLGEYFSDRPEKLLAIMRGISRRLRELTADYQEVCQSIGAWKESNDHGKEKGSRLMAAIKKYAAIFAESARYMNSVGSGLSYTFYSQY